jgi:N-acetylated-alpha-linked acidic dipeptidase
MKHYIAQVGSKLKSSTLASLSEEEEDNSRYRPTIITTTGSHSDLTQTFKRLDIAAGKLYEAAEKFDSHAAQLAQEAGEDIPWWKWLSKLRLFYEIHKTNTKIKFLERQFLYENGLDGRSWFKHVVFAPGLWTGYAGGK